MDESPIVRISPVATRSSHKAVALIDHARGVYGCDIQPGVWHTIFALASDTVVFEAKPGPYDAAVDKGFAPVVAGRGQSGGRCLPG